MLFLYEEEKRLLKTFQNEWVERTAAASWGQKLLLDLYGQGSIDFIMEKSG